MITYLTGDATHPQGEGIKIIAHVCNDIGAWGRGFVLSLSKRWIEPELMYRRWYQEREEMLIASWSDQKIALAPVLGNTLFVPVGEWNGWPPEWTDVTIVANMVAQHGILVKDDGTPPIRYGALESCLGQVNDLINKHWHGNATVHMPRIGCGLAGGKWSEIEPIIERALSNVDVFVYDFDTGDARTVPWSK